MAKTMVKKRGAAASKPLRRPAGVKASANKGSAAKRTSETRLSAKRPAEKRVARKPQPAGRAVATAVDAQVLAHGLNGLLHTMQAVQQFEETLCSLMHALRRGRATSVLMRELRDVLEQLPAQEYQHEVDALRGSLTA